MDCKPILQSVLIGFIFVSSVFSKDFKIYWNLPSSKCQDFGTPAINATQYGIIQNENDAFLGNQIAVLNDPGDFPAILKDPETGDVTYRNEGVPQEGDLHGHLQKFQNDVNNLIPDPNYSGIAVIRYDAWRPIFAQNAAAYRQLSISLEKKRPHPHWRSQATKHFGKAAREFMNQTLLSAKNLRPNAKWGFYDYPLCFNGRGINIDRCPGYVRIQNDGIQWLINESDVVLPSILLEKEIKSENRLPVIQGQVKEAVRMANQVKDKPKPEVLVYYTYLSEDTLTQLSQNDRLKVLNAIKESGADGVILSGRSSDFDTKEMCEKSYEIFTNELGPAVKSLQSEIS